MASKPLDSNVEISGEVVMVVVGAMKAATWLAEGILRNHGIDDPQPDRWYDRQAWLGVLHEIRDQVGALTLRRVGMSMFEDADWSPETTDAHAALGSLDVAYHEVHRRHSVPFYDAETETIRPGIGNYAYTATGDKSGTIVCTDPYPCEFDIGLVQRAVSCFGTPVAFVKVSHDGTACREKGDEACTYLVSW
jgi:hypothetical protein